MRRSFEAAGFTPEHAGFTELCSSGKPGEPEPYSTITKLVGELSEPFFVLCHQDIRLDRGHGIDRFRNAIRELDERDERWAVAGNAGGARSLRVIRSITDLHGGGTADSLPAEVHSLDENFLVVRTGTGIGCSPGLAGFHLFGTDICLNALEQGWRPYVIDFHLHHLSFGKRDEAFRSARSRFIAHWSSKTIARYVRTTIEVIFLSRWRPLRAMLGSATVRRILKNRALPAAIAGAVFAPRHGRAPKRNSTAGRRARP